MSMDLMVKAMKTMVGNPIRKLVLIKLADNANDMGECWPSYQHIADQCEIGRSTVKLHIRELERSGFLSREFRRRGELNQSNLFHLSLDGGAAIAPGGRAADNPPGAGDNPGGGAGSAPRTSHSLEPVKETHINEAFEAAWKAYPRRDGSNPKASALKAWNARIKEGVTDQAMIEGVARYASYCRQKETVGTGFVMQAVRFFGTNKEFENAWGMPTQIGGQSQTQQKTPTRAEIMAKGPRSDGKVPHPKWDSGVYQFVFPTDEVPEHLMAGQQ